MKCGYGPVLGLRLSRPRGYVAWARFVGLTLLSALTAITVLALLSALHVAERQQEVIEHRTPHYRPTAEAGKDSPAALLLREINARWDGLDLTVVTTATRDPGAAAPPGVPTLPGSGETYVSPAFLDKLATSSALQLLVGDDKVVGLISKSGLRSPAELRIVRGTTYGATPKDWSAPVTTFGAEAQRILDPSGPLAFVLPLTLVVIFLPLFLATALVSRLRAPETDYRSQLLNALGVATPHLRVVGAVEMFPACAFGALIAQVLFAYESQRVDHLPGTDYHFWSSDTALPLHVQLAAILLCITYTLTVAIVTGKPRQRTTTVAPTIGKPSATAWLLSPLLGAVALTLATFVESDPGRAKIFTIAASAILLVGLPGCSRLIIQRASSFCADRASGPSALLGGRRVGATRGAAFRLAAGLAVATLALALAAPFIQELKVDPRRGEDGLRTAHGYNVFVGSSSVSPHVVSQWPGVKHVLRASKATDHNGASIPVLYASCASLRAIVATRNCSGETQLIQVHHDQAVREDQYRPPLTLTSAHATVGRIPDSTVEAPLGDEFFGGILIPAVRATGMSDGTNGDMLVNLKDGFSSLDNFEAALISASPSAFLTNSYQDQIEQAQTSLGHARLVQVGSLIGMLALVIALAAAALRNLDERKRETRMLSVVGVPQKTAAVVHVIVQASPVLLSGILSAVYATVIWMSLARIDPHMTMSAPWWLGMAGAPLVTSATIALLTMPAAVLRKTGTAPRHDLNLWS